MYILQTLAKRRTCRGHTHALTLVLVSTPYMRGLLKNPTDEEDARNRSMIEFLQRIKDQGTILKVFKVMNLRLLEEGDEGWQGSSFPKWSKGEQEEVIVGEKFSANALWLYDC